MYVEQSTAFEAVYNAGETGLVPGLEIAIEDNDGNVVYGPTSVGIAELDVGGQPTGNYAAQVPAAPATLGQYTIIFSNDGSFDPDLGGAIDDLVVVAAGDTGVLPPIPPPDDEGLSVGPCTAWTTAAEVVACCSVNEGSDAAIFEASVDQASQVLFDLSGGLFPGLCQKTVRPCRTDCGCGFQVLSRGHIVSPSWSGFDWDCGGIPCGCQAISRVKLSGYPVREIVEVLIDGVVVDPTTYRLDEHQYLTRVRDPLEPDVVLRWPSCQALDLDDDQDGTFSVTYTYGQSPPFMAEEAAKQLACQISLQCLGEECQLPTGATRVTRQGITIERTFMQRDRSTGIWKSGLTAVDMFLNAYNPEGLRRRPMIWSPLSTARYARPVGS